MPNWRKPDEYPSPKDLTDREWAWEFLRRNPEYRQEWEEALRDWERDLPEWQRELREEFEAFKRDHPGEEIELRVRVEDDSLPPGRESFLMAPDPRSPRFIITGSKVLPKASRWGLGGYVNPDLDNPRSPFAANVSSEHHEQCFPVAATVVPFMSGDPSRLSDPPKKIGLVCRPHEVVAGFNLRLPIKPQLEGARDLLKSLKTSYQLLGGKVQTVKRHRELWELYLRLLDGSADGATYEEMAKVLFPEEHRSADSDAVKKVDDTLRSARRLTEPSGYLKLLAR